MEYMLQNHVFPLFSSELGYMRARVCSKAVLLYIFILHNKLLKFSFKALFNVNLDMATVMCA